MSAERVAVDDPEALRHTLTNAEALLLDFDSPVCSVFSGFPAHLVAHQVRGILAHSGHAELPVAIEKAEDPFDVLRFAATLGGNEAQYVEAAMRAHDVEAVATAQPTLGAHELVRNWHFRGRKLAIVSNNSATAVESYFQRHRLTAYVDLAVSRTAYGPALLKPDPYLPLKARDELEVSIAKCVLVGDSPTDIQAAHTAGTMAIGYANKPRKAGLLTIEGADSAITNMSILTAQFT